MTIKASKPLHIFIFLFITICALFIASQGSDMLSCWYNNLNQPSFSPPDFVFPIVWSLIYLIMAFVGASLWGAEKTKYRAAALTFWALQLVSATLWPFLFFTFQEPFLAFFCSLITWVFVLLCMILSFKVKKLYGILILPYFLWLCFAVVLSAATHCLNS